MVLFFRKISCIKEDIKISEFYSFFISTSESAFLECQIKQIVCLGLGKVSTCKVAQHQLAFLLLLSEHCNHPAEVYDPVFTVREKQALKRLNLTVIEENSEGKLKNSHPTLYFLPHCPRELSNNLLYSNWSICDLPKCLIIANSFSKLRLFTPVRLLKDYHYILNIGDLAHELPINNIFRFPDIFNDLSLHYFPLKKLESLDSNFWNRPEPNYHQESEFIQKP